MRANRGDWGRKVSTIVAICVLLIVFIKLGEVRQLYSSLTSMEEKYITITTAYTGEGVVELWDNDKLLLSGPGTISLSEYSDIRVKISCEAQNVITKFQINQEERAFEKGQALEEIVHNITEDTKIDVEFTSCNILTIANNSNCKFEVTGSVYSITSTENIQYYDDNEDILVRICPNRYWKLIKAVIDEKTYSLNEIPGIVHEKNDYIISISPGKDHKLIFVLTKETIPISIKGGRGQLEINNVIVKDGQNVERRDEYSIRYTNKSSDKVLNDIYINSNKIPLTLSSNWNEYEANYSTEKDVLDIIIDESTGKLVNTLRDSFILSDRNVDIYWPREKNTVYIKKHQINLQLVDDRNISKIYSTSNISSDRKGLYILNTGTIFWMSITDKSGTILCTNPHHFVYDGQAPSITGYKITAYETNQDGVIPMDLTVAVQDSGPAGIDQILCGTYEEYKHWEQVIANGEYESLHEKAEEQSTITIPNMEAYDKENCYVWAIDCASNLSAPIKLDMSGPELQCTTPEDWYNHNIEVNGVANKEITHIFCSTSYEDYLHHTLQSEKNLQSGNSKSKAWTFTIQARENKKQTIYIWGYDQYGNKSVKPCIFQSKVDITAPTLSMSRNIPEGKWSKEKITITLEAKDLDQSVNAGIKNVFYSTKEDGSNPVVVSSTNANGQYTLQSPCDEKGIPLEMNQRYFFWAEDQAGNRSKVYCSEVQVDTRVPVIDTVSICPESPSDKLHIKEWAICGTNTLEVIVKAHDPGHSSGLRRMYLYKDGKKVADALGNQGSYTFLLKEAFVGEVSFVVEDGVGHQSDCRTISELNARYITSRICLEKEEPEVKLSLPLANYTDMKGRRWFSKNVRVALSYMDEESGIDSLRVWVNDRELQQDVLGAELVSSLSPEKVAEYVIDTSQGLAAADGSYVIKVQAVDSCGNVAMMEKTVYVDTVKPTIGQFTFTSKGRSVSQTQMVQKESYGYYFEETTKVRVQGVDSKASSGVGRIAYYTVDYSKNHEGVQSKVIVKEADANGGIEFLLKSGFKGQIYAMIFDQVGHHMDEYSRPYGVIIESVESNSMTAGVDFVLPGTRFADAKNQPLYDDAITLTYTAKDYFNGIARVEWKVTSPQDRSRHIEGALEVDEKGKINGVSKGEVTAERDVNLVTEITKSLRIENNSNDIMVQVKVIDRAGHSFMKKISFSIDKTAPVIRLKAPVQERNELSYYATSQVVEVEIQERNFAPDKVVAEVMRDQTKHNSLSAWTKIENKENPGLTIYRATMSCKMDGEYQLKLQVKDLAENASNIATGGFVVDTIEPQVQVHFSGESTTYESHRFYKQGQMATITIKEKNLDPSRIAVECNRYPSIVSETISSRPTVSGFVRHGESHTATIAFKEDGWYRLRIACQDKAGNRVENEVKEEFGIDTRGPEIQVTGVSNQSAYNKELTPVVTIADSNYDSSQVKVTLTGSKSGASVIRIDKGQVKLDGVLKQIVDEKKSAVTLQKVEDRDALLSCKRPGHQLIFNCFPKEQQYDDYYILEIEAIDAAGNLATNHVEFSVNRFGSVYSFSQELQQLAGTYVQSMEDIVFTETNVNALVRGETQIKLSRNGVVSDLVESKDYQVEKLESSGQWCQYQYDISEKLFSEEGRYTLTVRSKDISGNVNENDLTSKDASIVFGVDRTKPIVVATNMKADTTYGEASKIARFSVSDNISLKKVTMYLNSKEIAYRQINDMYEIKIPDSKEKQNITVVATDSAGNKTMQQIENVYVTTNLWIRFWNNRLLVTVVITLFVLVIGAGIYLVVHYKTKPQQKMA